MKIAYRLFMLSSILILSMVINFSFADGFSQNDQGAAATAQGGAFVARANNLSALYFNPAGITQLDGTQISFGSNLIFPSTTFSNSGGKCEMRDQVFYPVNLYLSHKMSQKLSFGFGYYRPFAYSSKWCPLFIGRFISQEFNLRAHYFTPVVAYQASPEISVALGISYVYAKLDMSQSLDLSSFPYYYPPNAVPEGFSQFDSSGRGLAINLGLLYKLDEFWTLGISYRSAVDMDFSGNFDFTIPASSVGGEADEILNGLFPDQSGSMSLKMPQILVVGLSTSLIDRCSLEADIQWSGWSCLKEIPVNYSIITEAVKDKIIDRQWKNSFTFRLGAEYEYRPQLLLRAGYSYDNSSIPGRTFDSMIPEALKQSLSGGVGIKWSNIDFDVAYAAVFYEKRTEDNQYLAGTYERFAHILSFSVTFKL